MGAPQTAVQSLYLDSWLPLKEEITSSSSISRPDYCPDTKTGALFEDKWVNPLVAHLLPKVTSDVSDKYHVYG